VTYLTQSYRERSVNVKVQIEAEDVMLDIDTAIPCGLIVNELVTNSLKYAFPENQPGCVKLTCHPASRNGNYDPDISDDGVGLPDGFDISQAPSLGYKLVTNLTNQLEGKLEFYCTDRGTTCRVSFERRTMSKTRVLIVEDERIVAMDIQNSLAASGYDIAVKQTGGRMRSN
jgi:two-component system, sensor histidine kinase PdtaS